MYTFIVIAIVLGFILLIGGLIWLYYKTDLFSYEPPEKRAGREGERYATGLIQEVLRDSDLLYTNVIVFLGDKQRELDDVIINRNGVFIIEVKNWKGEVHGDEDDYDWVKYDITSVGNTYSKILQNPIRQVRTEIHYFASFLRDHGFDVWVNGYVFFVEHNSPVESDYVLETIDEFDSVLHTPGKKPLSEKTVRRIEKLMDQWISGEIYVV